MKNILTFWNNDRFTFVSWLVTVTLVASLLGGALWWKGARSGDVSTAPVPTAGPNSESPALNLGLPPVSVAEPAVGRRIQLITNIPADLPRYGPLKYTVERGDAMSKIAEKFKITTETILFNNKDVLNDDPHGLRPGMILLIAPVDGIYYVWQQGDTLENVAAEFKADVEDVVNFAGNDVDLTNPDFKPGTMVMIPGGSRDLVDWSQFVPTYTRGSGTGTSETGGSSCGGGLVGDGAFGWPGSGSHIISGNGFGAGHLGIDISANEGDAVFAADAGVVTFAGWSEYGYGNMIQIDHGNGYVSLYAHLSQINVSVCTSVGQGTVIGLAGNSGNSFGAHLHFEIRLGGANVNPLGYVQ